MNIDLILPDKSGPKKPVKKRRRDWTQFVRRGVQIGFLLFVIFAALRHAFFEETTTAASIDAICPMGGLETLWRTWTSGEFVPKTHPSNLVLGLGLLAATLAAGAAFCGWICPFGTLQDGLTWLRTRLHLPELRIPAQIDRWLRYGRFVTLALILYMTIRTTTLWFADYDPYRTLFGLGWLTEFNWAEQWVAYTVLGVVLASSCFVPRFWCKYTCPLGGALSLLGHFSLLRIRRTEASCKGCALCETPCPVGIAVASANPMVNTNCIGCLACVDVCPRHGALEVQWAPVAWWGTLRSWARRGLRPAKNISGGVA
jgi:polyferredoxin